MLANAASPSGRSGRSGPRTSSWNGDYTGHAEDAAKALQLDDAQSDPLPDRTQKKVGEEEPQSNPRFDSAEVKREPETASQASESESRPSNSRQERSECDADEDRLRRMLIANGAPSVEVIDVRSAASKGWNNVELVQVEGVDHAFTTGDGASRTCTEDRTEVQREQSIEAEFRPSEQPRILLAQRHFENLCRRDAQHPGPIARPRKSVNHGPCTALFEVNFKNSFREQ